jgi:hypothetical protein
VSNNKATAGAIAERLFVKHPETGAVASKTTINARLKKEIEPFLSSDGSYRGEANVINDQAETGNEPTSVHGQERLRFARQLAAEQAQMNRASKGSAEAKMQVVKLQEDMKRAEANILDQSLDYALTYERIKDKTAAKTQDGGNVNSDSDNDNDGDGDEIHAPAKKRGRASSDSSGRKSNGAARRSMMQLQESGGVRPPKIPPPPTSSFFDDEIMEVLKKTTESQAKMTAEILSSVLSAQRPAASVGAAQQHAPAAASPVVNEELMAFLDTHDLGETGPELARQGAKRPSDLRGLTESDLKSIMGLIHAKKLMRALNGV